MKVVVSGMGKEKAAQLIRQLAGASIEVLTMDDYEGALAVKRGEADYYLGMCQSGAGGALAMAIALLGRDKCATVSTAGRPPRQGEVVGALDRGAVALGLASDHIDKVVPIVVEYLMSLKESASAVEPPDA